MWEIRNASPREGRRGAAERRGSRGHSMSLEREILQLRERAGRKQRGDSDAAASHVQNQVYWPHHGSRVHEGGLDQPSQGILCAP